MTKVTNTGTSNYNPFSLSDTQIYDDAQYNANCILCSQGCYYMYLWIERLQLKPSIIWWQNFFEVVFAI
jgi:hypothetical protein